MTASPEPALPTLRPCPFCNGPAEFEHLEGGRWSVGCNDDDGEAVCMGYMALTTFATRREAAEAWNRRASPEPATVGDRILSWLQRNANAEKEPKARAAFIEAHNAAMAIKRDFTAALLPAAGVPERLTAEALALAMCEADGQDPHKLIWSAPSFSGPGEPLGDLWELEYLPRAIALLPKLALLAAPSPPSSVQPETKETP